MTDKKPNFANIMGNQLKDTREKIKGQGIDSLIPPQPSEIASQLPTTRKVSPSNIITASPRYVTQENEVRATFLIKQDVQDKIKSYAYYNRVLVKDILDEALTDWITKVEATEGPIKMLPRPKKRR